MMSFNTPNRRYLITSHGNGWAYEITDQETGESLWFQDSDAARLQEETQDFELESVLDQYFEGMVSDEARSYGPQGARHE